MADTLYTTDKKNRQDRVFLGLQRQNWHKIKKMKFLYLLLLFPVIHWTIFHYIPMYGLLIAFKDFNLKKGVLGSPWNNFAHFKFLFTSPGMGRIMRNTIFISLLKLSFGFITSIVFALLVNELLNLSFKRIMQSISYLPHFMSWVVLGGIIKEILSPHRGAINAIITNLGGEPVFFLTSEAWFLVILVISSIWQGVGWTSIIYLAVLASVDPCLYEAAEVDGVSRFQRAIHISLPSLIPLISIVLIMRMGGIMNAGFDQIFNLYNPLVYDVADVLDTYIFRVGLVQMKYDYATAIGFFRNFVGLLLVLASNFLAKRYTDYGIW